MGFNFTFGSPIALGNANEDAEADTANTFSDANGTQIPSHGNNNISTSLLIRDTPGPVASEELSVDCYTTTHRVDSAKASSTRTARGNGHKRSSSVPACCGFRRKRNNSESSAEDENPAKHFCLSPKVQGEPDGDSSISTPEDLGPNPSHNSSMDDGIPDDLDADLSELVAPDLDRCNSEWQWMGVPGLTDFILEKGTSGTSLSGIHDDTEPGLMLVAKTCLPDEWTRMA